MALNADLKLYETGALSCSAPQMDVNALEETWSESTTWSTRPNVSAPSTDNLVVTTTATLGYSGACPAGWVSISDAGEGHLTMGDLVNAWLMGILDNDGIELRADDESLTTTWRRFKSSEATSQTPVLSVKYLIGTDAAELETLPEFAANYLVDSGSIEPGPDFDGCLNETSPDANDTVPYESYVRGQNTVYVNGDVFWPASETGTYPLVILAHGGGWWRGCRGALNDQALYLVQTTIQPFVVYDIDYRLACDPNDPNLLYPPIRGLCGFFYKDADPLNGFGYQDPGAAIHDILNALAYARANINTICPWTCWDGTHVFIGGGSAGGNLSDVAAALGYADGGEDYQVDGTFSWSGTSLLGFDTCSLFYSRGPGICFGETNQYVCGNWTPPGHPALFSLDSACTDDVNWNHQNDYEQAGAYLYYTSTSEPTGDELPPIFFANGGFCGDNEEGGGCNEDIGWKQSQDLENGMNGLFYTNKYQCKVDLPAHAVKYLDHPCLNGTEAMVFDENIAWMVDKMTP